MADDAKAPKKDDKGQGDEAAPTEVAASSGKSKLPLVLGAIGLVIVSAGAPTAFFLLKAKHSVATEELASNAAKDEEEPVAEGHDDEEQLGDDEERLGAILPLETFLINLDGGRYLRAQVQLEFSAPTISAAFIRNQVVVRDGLISLMSRRTADELAAVKGRDTLKSDIRELINQILKREEIKRVFFTQFVIQ